MVTVNHLPKDYFDDAFSIGVDSFNRWVNKMQNVMSTNNSKYPPYNIIKLNDDMYVLEMAVAGIDESKLSVDFNDNILTISYDPEPTETEAIYLIRGISNRKFSQVFAVGKWLEISKAEIANGMLSIYVQRVIPTETESTKIEITKK